MTAGTPGSIVCRGKSGASYNRQVWFPDAAGSSLRFDQGAGVSATLGETFTTFPEDVYITDIVLTTVGTPAATFFRLTLNGAPTVCSGVKDHTDEDIAAVRGSWSIDERCVQTCA